MRASRAASSLIKEALSSLTTLLISARRDAASLSNKDSILASFKLLSFIVTSLTSDDFLPDLKLIGIVC